MDDFLAAVLYAVAQPVWFAENFGPARQSRRRYYARLPPVGGCRIRRLKRMAVGRASVGRGDAHEHVQLRDSLVQTAPAMTLAAEMQWSLVPTLTVGSERVVVSGMVQPSYEVGDDIFDYALGEKRAHVAIFDAMGHGLEAALLVAVAVGPYRNARRRPLR